MENDLKTSYLTDDLHQKRISEFLGGQKLSAILSLIASVVLFFIAIHEMSTICHTYFWVGLNIFFDILPLDLSMGSMSKRQKELSLQSAKMAALGEMASGIAHEVNNPLSIIMLRVNSLKKKVGKIPKESFQNNMEERQGLRILITLTY